MKIARIAVSYSITNHPGKVADHFGRVANYPGCVAKHPEFATNRHEVSMWYLEINWPLVVEKIRVRRYSTLHEKKIQSKIKI